MINKGFTLIELLIVIAILAILAVAVVVVLNPAELLKQGRDSTRISDLASLNSAIALFLTDVVPAAFTPTSTCTFATSGSPIAVNSPTTCQTSAVTAVDGSGWVNVNFGQITGGSPLPRLPIDPVNDVTNFYAWKSSSSPSSAYEINANLESVKYASGANSLEANTKDGGNRSDWYEVGSNLAL